MLPSLPTSLENDTVKMLAIVEKWEDGCHKDNTSQFMLLALFKAGLDATVLCLCFRKTCSFVSAFSFSVVLFDALIVFFLTTKWYVGDAEAFVPICYILAHASAAYAVLPLPAIALLLWDYILEGAHILNYGARCRPLRNILSTFGVWLIAIKLSYLSASADLMGIEYNSGTRALVCDVQESKVFVYSVLGVFAALVLSMAPFWSKIPQWVTEAGRLLEVRDKLPENQRSDLLLTSTKPEYTEEDFVKETAKPPPPPLWFSLTLGFASFWMPYLILSVTCEIFGFGVPAYITVNLVWLECMNSLVVGVMFWARSETHGPYSDLPANMCPWHIYWHLSRGTRPQQLPKAVTNPANDGRHTLLCV